MKNLILVRGISGSGKTTVANLFNGTTFSTDEYWELAGGYKFDATNLGIAHEWNQNRVENAMNVGLSLIVVHNTFTTYERELKPYFDLAKKYNYMIHTIIVENRHNGVNQHNVPQETLDKQKSRFQIQL